MKKILSLLLCVMLLFSLTGCGKEKTSENENNKTTGDVALYPVKDKETQKYGYVNEQGEWVIEPKFQSASGFDPDTGLARARTSSDTYSTGFINKQGEFVIEDKWGFSTSSFYNGYAVLETDISNGHTYSTNMVVDKDENVLIEAGKYVDITDVSVNGLIGVVESSGIKYIKTDGTVVIDKNFGSDGTMFNKHGVACVETKVLSNAYILIDEEGNQIGNTTFGRLVRLNDNNLGFGYKNDFYAIINGDGEILSDYKYYDVSRFNEENIALVQDNSSLPWYFINEKGEKINDATYKYFSLLPDGSWVATKDDGSIDILKPDGSLIVTIE